MRKPIPGWLGYYEVSESGEVWSVERSIVKANGSIQRWPERKMKLMRGTSGYLIVRLSRPGLRKMVRVHRIVAETFIPNPSSLPEVNHIDGDRANPHVSNLEWCTPSENRRHAYHVLRSITMPRTGKLSHELAAQIRREHVPGANGYRRLAMKYGVNRTAIRSVLRNRTYPLPQPPKEKP